MLGRPSTDAMPQQSAMPIHLPTGVSQSPKGDIGAHRQQEAKAVGGFTSGKAVKAASFFTTRYKGAS
jgi:hypothetical protein